MAATVREVGVKLAESFPVEFMVLTNDITVLTGAVRELHRAYPGEFAVDIRTSYPE